ncbi:hypothetical protein TNCV_3049041 [Trichonephila clavipes]|nr:hypothetical protein TNCV_3049041 [Trichonephila clavipes]
MLDLCTETFCTLLCPDLRKENPSSLKDKGNNAKKKTSRIRSELTIEEIQRVGFAVIGIVQREQLSEFKEKIKWHFNSPSAPCDEAHFWLNGYVNKQNCHIWSEANPQVYVETPLHPEKLTVWCALWAGGILLQKR